MAVRNRILKRNKFSTALSIAILTAVQGTLLKEASASVDTWSAASSSADNWNSAGAWSGDNPPHSTDTLLFTGTSGYNTSNNNQTGLSVSGIQFNTGATAYTLTGNSLTITGNVTDNNPSAIDQITLILTGTPGIQANNGTLILDGANSYTGNTLIAGGATLQIGNNDNTTAQLGDATVSGSASVVTDNGTLLIDLENSNPDWYDTFSGTGAFTLESATGTTIVLDGNDSNFQGTINVGAAGANDRLRFDNANNLPGASSTIVVQNGSGIYANTAFNYAGTLDLNGVGDAATDSPTYGTLRFGVANTNETGTVDLQSNALFGLQNSATISGQITGPGQLEIAGSSTLILTNAADNWAGGTAIYNGTLQLQKAMSSNPLGNVTFGSNTGYVGAATPTSGTLDLDGTSQTVSGLAVAAGSNNVITDSSTSAGTLNFAGGTNPASSFSGAITGSALSLNVSSGSLTLDGANTYTGATTITGGTTLQIGNNDNTTAQLGDATASGSASSVTDNGTLLIDLENSNPDWYDTFTGTGAITLESATGSSIILDGNNSNFQGTINVGAAGANDRLRFDNANNLPGGSSTIVVQNGSGIYANTAFNYAGTLDLNGVGDAATDSPTYGAVRFGVANTNETGTVDLQSNAMFGLQDSATISGKITGFGQLEIAGSGTLILTNTADNWTGGTAIYNGTLQLQKAMPANPLGNVTFGSNTGYVGAATPTSGTLDFDGTSQTVTGLAVTAGSNNVITDSSTSASTLNFAGGTTSSSFSGAITGSALSLNVASGSVTLNGSLTYDGTTTIGNGDYTKISGNNTETLHGNVSGGGTLTVGDGTTTTSLTLSGANNTYSGGTTVNANSTLISGAANAFGSGGLTVNGGAVQLGGHNQIVAYLQGSGGSITDQGVLTFGGSGTYTYSGSISDGANPPLSLVDNNTSTQILNGLLSYTGTTTINSGTLQISCNYTETLHGNVSGDGTLIVGDGTTSTSLTLSGANNTYSGGTTVNTDSTLIGGATNAFGSGGLNVNGGAMQLDGFNESVAFLQGSGGSITNNSTAAATLTFTGNSNSGYITYSGAIGDDGTGKLSLVDNNVGVYGQVLNGQLNYTGTTTIGSGDYLQISGNNIDTLSGAIAANGAILMVGDFSTATNLTLSNSDNAIFGLWADTNSTIIGAATNAFGGGNLFMYGGAIELDGFNETISNLSGFGGSITNTSALPATLTITGNVVDVYSGSMADGPGGGTLSLVDNDVSGQILNGPLSYTGSTTIGFFSSLQISGANTEILSGNVSGGGTLTVGDDTTATNLTLDGQLSYIGATAINTNSTLQISGSNTETLSGAVSGGGYLTVGDGITVTNLTLSGLLSYAGATTLNNNSNLRISGNHAENLSGNISGGGTLTVGDGTMSTSLTLSGPDNNLFSGGATVNANSTLIGAAAYVFGVGTLNVNGGAVQLGGFNETVFSFLGSGGSVTNHSTKNATLTFGGGSSNTFSGSISDGTGGGTLSLVDNDFPGQILNGPLSYTGSTTIGFFSSLQISGHNTDTLSGAVSGGFGGYLTVGDGITATNLTLSGQLSYAASTVINTNSTLQISGANTEMLSGDISGGGTLIVGDGTTTTSLTLSGANNTYSGGTSVNANSTLIGDSTNAFGSGGLTVNGGAVQLDGFNESVAFLQGSGGSISDQGVLTFGGSGTYTYSGSINDGAYPPLSLVDNNTGTQILNGPLSYSGTTTINAGTLQISGNNFDILSGNIVGGGALIVGDGTTYTGLILSGANNTYSGGTTVNANSTLIGGATNAFGSGPLTVNGGAMQLGGFNQTVAYLQGSGGAITDSSPTSATLTFGGSGTYTFSGSISDGALILDGNNGNGGPITFYFMHGSLSLVDNNTGTQILNGPLSYTGSTTINSGTLQISGNNSEILRGTISGAGNLTVGDGITATNLALSNLGNNLSGSLTVNTPGGTLAATGSFGAATLTAGTLQTAGSTPDAGGTLTLASLNASGGTLTLASLNASGGTLLFSVGNAGVADLITINGFAALGNSVEILLNGIGTPTVGENIPLLTARDLVNSIAAAGNGSLAGGIAGGESIYVYQGGATLSGALASDAAYAAAASADDLFLYVAPAGAPTLYWNNAAANGQWDIHSSSNWNDVIDMIDPAQYSDGDNVVFDDAHNTSGNYNVMLNTTVNPSSVTVNNSAGNYVISGAGSIAGATSLVKEGSGNLTLSTANSYTGGTTIGDGTLIVGNSSAIPVGSSVTLGDGTNNATLDLGGVGATVGSLAVAAGSYATVTNNENGSATLTFAGGTNPGSIFSGAITDGSYQTALLVSSGSLELSGTNTFSGGATVTGGTLFGGATNAFGSGDLTVNGGYVQLIGYNETVAYLQGSGGNIMNSSPYPATLTFGGSGSYTFSGSISDYGNFFGINNRRLKPVHVDMIVSPLSLVDNNTGLQILNGPLSYSGYTSINGGGTLQISGNNTDMLNGNITGNDFFVVGDGTTATNLTLNGTFTSYGGYITVNNNSVLTLSSTGSIVGGPQGINIAAGGTLHLDGLIATNGPLIDNGELDGNGSVEGDVIVNPGGTLLPGNPFGVFTVDGNVTLGGTFAAQVDPDNSENPPNSELVASYLGAVAIGGALTVTASNADPLTAGSSFTLISTEGGIQNGPGVQTAFSSVSLPALNPGLSWDTTLLNDNPAEYQSNYTISVVDSVPAGFTLGNPIYTAALTPGQSYKGYYIQNLGGQNTDVQFLDGTITTGTTLAVQFANRSGNNPDMISDVATISGTGTDTYVLELNYIATDVTNGTLSPVLAVEHNNVFEAAVLLDPTQHEVAGAYNPSTDDVLGDYGIDPTNHEVWAVLDYSGGDEFGVYQRIPGDLTGGGTVTPSDLGLVQTNLFGSTGGLWSRGDFQGAGLPTDTVTPGDLALVQTNLFATEHTGGSEGSDGGLITSSPVPEPGSLGLIAIGSLGLMFRRRSKYAV
jgi:fibronectin-binding autotransporter adhesin